MKKVQIVATVITLLLIGCDSEMKDNNQSIATLSSDNSSSYSSISSSFSSSSSFISVTYEVADYCNGDRVEVTFKTTIKKAEVGYANINYFNGFSRYCEVPSSSNSIERNDFFKNENITQGHRTSASNCYPNHYEKLLKESDINGSVDFVLSVPYSAYPVYMDFYLDSGIDIISGLSSKLYYLSNTSFSVINSLSSILSLGKYSNSDYDFQYFYEYMQISDINTSKKEVLIADVQMRVYVGLITGYLSSLSDKNSYRRLNEYVYNNIQIGFENREDIISSAFIQEIMKDYSSDLYCEDTSTFDAKVPVVSEAIETFVKEVRVKLEKSSEYKLSAKELLLFSQLEVEEDYLDNSSITFDSKTIESRLANIQ